MKSIKYALVTGGSSGIGLAVATSLVERGYHVTITGRRKSSLEQTANSLGCEWFVCDISCEDDIQTLAMQHADWPLHALVNNAGIAPMHPFHNSDAGHLMQALNVNLKGPLLLAQALLPRLSAARGSITNVSSAIVDNGVAGGVGYAASKGALNAATKSLAIELAPLEVRVNAVAPGLVNTPIFSKMGLSNEQAEQLKSQLKHSIPLRRLAEPREIAHVIIAQLESSYTTGSVWYCDGGVNAV